MTAASETAAPGPWTCPECRRRFGRRNQSHTCRPAMPLDAYFAARPPEHRRIYDAVASHLRDLGPIEVDAVDVGILIKRSRTFVELRPRRDGLALSFLLSRPLDHPRIARAVPTGSRRNRSGRTTHFVHIRTADDIDELVRSWLTESYLDSPE